MMEFCFERFDIKGRLNTMAVVPGQDVKTASVKMVIVAFFTVWIRCCAPYGGLIRQGFA